MEGVFLEIAAVSLSAITTAAVTAIIAMLKNLRKRQQAEDVALKALLRTFILDAYSDHVLDGEPLSVDRMQEIEQISQAYSQLGGNGTAKHQVEELMNLRPWVKA